MAIRVVESPDSGDLHYGAQGGGQVLKYTVVTTAGETKAAVFLAALAGTLPYLNGFVRNDLKIESKNGAANVYAVEVNYGTTGVGGGDQPLGGVGNDGGPPMTPSGPGSPTTPLTSGWTFRIQAPTLHLTTSLGTVDKAKRGGGAAPDFKRRIGVDRDGKTQGCDVPPAAAFTFSRTIARATVTQGYLNTLSAIAGKPNNAPFYGWEEGEVLLMSAYGTYTQNDGWSITFEFGVQKNDNNVIVCGPSAPGATDGLPAIPGPGVFTKKGWEYLWVKEEEIPDPVTGAIVTVPGYAYIEKVLEPADFSLLEIGT
ncbi:hypothetical protein J8F10_09425 [Gemmata sp. G18]|uniref:Uncharacterized protein n=1 Tax=Gemmata palustris TaxID=2822762 RepID=A0ABS5BP52_9BACT|nr:hypothetical protein [Gemmata palustris]MBP3955501.1 hypothetical protein [Gemmata palustris]